MIEWAGSRAEGLRARREAGEIASFVRRLDWVLIASIGALVGYGLWGIAGITQHDVPGNPNYYVTRQAIFVAVGVIGLVVAAIIDPDLYQHRWKPMLTGTAVMIAIVLLQGETTRGSKRWLELGFFRFQPSEFGKVLFVLFLAGFLAERGRAVGRVRTARPTTPMPAATIWRTR